MQSIAIAVLFALVVAGIGTILRGDPHARILKRRRKYIKKVSKC